MINLHDIRYCRLGTPDLTAATRFCTDIVGLEKVRSENGCTYFRGDDRDHTLVYFQGDPADQVLAFELKTNEEIDQAIAELTAAGIAVGEGNRDECVSRRVERFIWLRDPTGNRIELVWRPFHSGRRYFPSRDAGIMEFNHVGLCTTDVARDEIFWKTLFNWKVADRIGPAPLLRFDGVHHKMALFPTNRTGLQHINHQVHTIDDIMRNWYFLQNQGIEIVFGPGRHPTSGAVFLYFAGPDGLTYEYSMGVKRDCDDPNYHPRQFPFDPTGFCMWGSKPNIKEFK